MDPLWLQQYPAGVPAQVRTDTHPSLVAMLAHSMARHRERVAFCCMGRQLRYGELDDLSTALAAWLQAQGLQRGDRVALLLPNVLPLPVAVLAVLRAGGVVVNIGPELPQAELQHRLRDSGARVCIAGEAAAATLQAVVDSGTVALRHVVVASLGDLQGALKGPLLNHWQRRVKRAVPQWHIRGAVSLHTALEQGRHKALAPVALGPDDLAALQYTGGTTGTSRGAVLLHRNLVANVLQAEAWNAPALQQLHQGGSEGDTLVQLGALPLHHIYGFTLVLLLGLHQGACTVLVPHTQDTAGLLKLLARHRVHVFAGVNALFQRLAEHPDVDRVDWSALRLAVGGATAVEAPTALLWLLKTGVPICQGYGLSEAGPAVTCNPVTATAFSPHLGLPLPGTDVKLIDDEGRPVPAGLPGEIAVRGPQVMAGYWQRPDDTARVMTPDGYLRTGDIGQIGEDGGLLLVDRKKDLIFVSGFNVYPNEVETVVAQLQGVQACAAVAMPDDKAGEAVRLVLVKTDPASAVPSEADVRAHCAVHLAGYKRPKVVEFRPELPTTAVGKVLRRELRDAL
jgi:long-chain acyl-CoA synthetase